LAQVVVPGGREEGGERVNDDKGAARNIAFAIVWVPRLGKGHRGVADSERALHQAGSRVKRAAGTRERLSPESG
jgi:hypothetical protein